MIFRVIAQFTRRYCPVEIVKLYFTRAISLVILYFLVANSYQGKSKWYEFSILSQERSCKEIDLEAAKKPTWPKKSMEPQ